MGEPAASVSPGRTWYVWAVVLLVAGLAAGAWGMVSFFSAVLSPMAGRFVVPGEGAIRLDKPGTYVICYENRSVVNGKTYVTPDAFPGLQCSLREKATGVDVAVAGASGSYTYTAGAISGRAIWEFRADKPGTYELKAAYPQGVTGPSELVLAVGEGFPWKAMVKLFVSIGAGGLCCLAALAVFLVTLIRRQRCMSRRQGVPAPTVFPPS